MKSYSIKLSGLRIIIIIFLNCLILSAQAQSREILARIAFEDAEIAFEAKNLSLAWAELNKVDSLLKQLTPKSQYLRVFLWKEYAILNSENFDGAIKACKTYLKLSESLELSEDKVLEITRLMVKLQKDKDEYLALRKAKEAAYKNYEDSMNKIRNQYFKNYQVLNNYLKDSFFIYRGMPLDSLRMSRNEIIHFMKNALGEKDKDYYPKGCDFSYIVPSYKRDIPYDPGIIRLKIDEENRVEAIRISLFQTKNRQQAIEAYLNHIQVTCKRIYGSMCKNNIPDWYKQETANTNQSVTFFTCHKYLQYSVSNFDYANYAILLIKHEKQYSLEISFGYTDFKP